MTSDNVIPHSSGICGALIAARVQLTVPVKLPAPLQVIGFLPEIRNETVIAPEVSIVDAIDDGSRNVPVKPPSYGPDVRKVEETVLLECNMVSCGIATSVRLPVLTCTNESVPAQTTPRVTTSRCNSRSDQRANGTPVVRGL